MNKLPKIVVSDFSKDNSIMRNHFFLSFFWSSHMPIIRWVPRNNHKKVQISIFPFSNHCQIVDSQKPVVVWLIWPSPISRQPPLYRSISTKTISRSGDQRHQTRQKYPSVRKNIENIHLLCIINVHIRFLS